MPQGTAARDPQSSWAASEMPWRSPSSTMYDPIWSVFDEFQKFREVLIDEPNRPQTR